MLPGRADVTNARVSEKIGEAEKRGDQRHDDAGPEKPQRGRRPDFMAG
jgi:hypothetical protein